MFLMAYKNMVSVKVCGKTMTLTGNESVEYITKVANYIEDKSAMIRGSENSKNLSPTMVSVLTSINIADDYFKALDEIEKLKGQLPAQTSGKDGGYVTKATVDEINSLKAENEKIKAENASLKAEGEKVKAENEAVKAENEKLKAENDTVKTENSSAKESSEKDRKELEIKTAELESASKEKNEAFEERDNILKELEELKSKYEELEKKTKATEEDNIKKIAQINHLKSMESRFLEYEKKMEAERKLEESKTEESSEETSPAKETQKAKTNGSYYKRI